MKTVHLARGLTLPAAELATKVTGAFGIRGSGKSNLMAVVVEGMLAAKVQVIVMDPVGIHFSLRLAPNGKSPSEFQIPVLGGRHGDLVLQPTAGEVVGRALALSNGSCVLDISSMKKGERIRFSGAFFEAFYEGKKENSSPVLLCLEEAQRFAPQLMFKGSGQEQMLGAIEELAEQGRNYGAGIWLNSLRPQKINKDVTSLMDLLFSFRLTGNHERKFVHDWLQEKGAEDRDEIQGELPGLPEGYALVWSPAVFNIFGKYHFHKKTTYDAGATPLHARAKVKIRTLDLDNLEKEMAGVVEEAKANDPRALRARIAELEREMVKKGTGTVRVVEKPVIREADFRRLERLTEKLAKAQKPVEVAIDRLGSASAAVVTAMDNLRTVVSKAVGGTEVLYANGSNPRVSAPSSQAEIARVSSPRPAFVDPGRGPRQAQIVRPAQNGEQQLSRCARTILNVLAQRGRASDSQISALSGYRKTSSGFANALSELRVKGFINGTPERREITQAGREHSGPIEPLPKGPALLDYWLPRLGKQEGAMLRTVYNHGTISRAAIAEETNYSATSSGFTNAISALRVLDLVHGPNGGDLTIADVFRE